MNSFDKTAAGTIYDGSMGNRPWCTDETSCGTTDSVKLNWLSLLEQSKEANEKVPTPALTDRQCDSSDIKSTFPELLKKLNVSQPNQLTLNELDKAIGDVQITGQQAQVLVALKTCFAKIEALDPSPSGTRSQEKRITDKAVQSFHEKLGELKAGNFKDEGFRTLVDEANDAMKRTKEASGNTLRTLYADNKRPLDSIIPTAVEQAGIGNCYFFGALAAMAAANPQEVRKMIAENPDGSHTVTFPSSKPLHVTGPSEAEIALFPKTGKYGTWVWVLEKAYGQYCMEDSSAKLFRKMLGRSDSPIPQEHTEGPSFFDGGLKILTGKSMKHIWNDKPDDMHKRLEEIMQEKPRRPITADASIRVKTGTGAPVWMHTYSILDYNARDKIMTLRNPWGSTPPTAGGVKDLGNGKFTMSLDLFQQYFSRISFPER